LQLYKQSAELDNSNGQNRYGICLHYGFGIPVDLEEVVRYFSKLRQIREICVLNETPRSASKEVLELL
jgi:aspartyl/asparaginyl-tRNA synthetase